MTTPVLSFVGANAHAPSNESSKLSVVFVHGITGDRFDTWSAGPGQSWLNWIADDSRDIDVYTAGYDSSFFASWCRGPGPSLVDRSTTLLDAIVSEKAKFNNLAIVTHSLGGLIVKQMLRKCVDGTNPAYADLLQSLRGVIFIATPHQGANLASALAAIFGSVTSKSIAEMKAGSDALSDLTEWYRNWVQKSKIITASYYETQKTRGALVVDKLTGNPFVAGCDPVAVDADHISICKPSSREAPIYISITNLLNRMAARTTESEGTVSAIQPTAPPTKRLPEGKRVSQTSINKGNAGDSVGFVGGDYNKTVIMDGNKRKDG